MPTGQALLVYATAIIHVSWLAVAAIFLLHISPLKTRRLDEKMLAIKQKAMALYKEISLIFVTAATAGSLYFSEILGFEPCPLCWYQRVFMYPLVVILGISVILEKKSVHDYILPLALIGSGISAYHYLVQMIDEIQSGCAAGTACEAQHVLALDYITIPMMAFTAFATVVILNWTKFEE